MKVNYEYSLINKQTTNKSLNSRQYEFDEHKNNLKNNTTRPAQAISFSGSIVSSGQKAMNDLGNKIKGLKLSETIQGYTNKLGDNIVENKFFSNLVDFVYDNEVAYNAVYSLLIAGVLKPALILKTKEADEKDKQIIATKNFLQAFIGSFLSYTIGGTIIKKAVDVINNNLTLLKFDKDTNSLKVMGKDSAKALEQAEKVLKKAYKMPFSKRKALIKSSVDNAQGINKIGAFFKALSKKIDFEPTQEAIKQKAAELVETCENHKSIFEKNPNFVKTLIGKTDESKTINGAYKTMWKNSTGWITSIMKAKISSLLLPGVMAFIFAKRNLEIQREKEEKEKQEALKYLHSRNEYKDPIEKFKSYLNKEQNNQIAFKGSAANVVIDNLAKGIETISMSSFGEKSVEILAKLPKPTARMNDIESGLLTTWWVQNTIRSKKIDPDQKLGLNVQTILVTLIASASAFIIDALLDGLLDKGEKKYAQILEEKIKNVAKEISNNPSANLEQLIKESCKKLSGAEEIAKKIIKSNADITNSAAIKKIAETLAKNYKGKLGKFKSLTIFTFVVRFLVPVLTVKPAGKLKQKIKEYMKERREKLENKEKENKELEESKDVKKLFEAKKEKDD